ncbi:hypothetical protein [Actinoplanes flavus]|uniref:Restriction endonuclease n=1 Tax=Actinoplanes flavus TaxID=2820290 RepID=A0ABS3USZ7_9ACTN|nr:hypothetical protein [Actinoplanes flavus]MBO3741705.1 hypothetical protein [Actinoplanes flavus]
MRDGIDWTAVGSGDRFEKIVSVLLSSINPESERIDGAGGDGGRDHQFRDAEGLHVWQSKFFPRRLNEARGRKDQITKSLAAAASLNPVSWTLVTPMMANPTERSWFEGLQGDYPFPLTWKGGDWLDSQLAERPAIVRHFMGANDEYVALLRELRQEQDALVDGLPAALPRIENLAAKINDSNPFYRVDFTVRGGVIVETALVPKYVGADRDSPRTFGFSFATGAADTGLIERFQLAMDWGDRIELPSEAVGKVVMTGPPGFGGEWENAHLVFGPANPEPLDIGVRLLIQNPAGRQVAALPARLVSRVSGQRGLTLRGRDLTGVIEVRVRLIPELSEFTLSLSTSWSKSLLPTIALPVLRFLRHASPPNTLTLEVGETRIKAGPVDLPEGVAVSEEQLRIVADLDRLQVVTGNAFPMPFTWNVEDLVQVDCGVRLLDGEAISIGRGPITFTSRDNSLEKAILAGSGSSLSVGSESGYIIEVFGHQLDLGPCIVTVPGPRATSRPSAEGEFETIVVPGEGKQLELRLGLVGAGSGDEDSD